MKDAISCRAATSSFAGYIYTFLHSAFRRAQACPCPSEVVQLRGLLCGVDGS
jgi:hypothetical protein